MTLDQLRKLQALFVDIPGGVVASALAAHNLRAVLEPAAPRPWWWRLYWWVRWKFHV